MCNVLVKWCIVGWCFGGIVMLCFGGIVMLCNVKVLEMNVTYLEHSFFGIFLYILIIEDDWLRQY